jgi:branched-chain amino acid transport system permease protein
VIDLTYFVLAGLGVGALYAMTGAGIVVAYRGSGVINFAQGAVTTYCVFQFTELRANGTIVLPWIDVLPGNANLPVRIELTGGRPMTFMSAIVGTLAMAVLIGVLMHVLAFRPLRKASALGKVIGSVGVLIYLQGVALVHFGGTGRQLERVFPERPWRNFLGLGRSFPQRNVWAALAALVLAGLVAAIFRYTRFGISSRAAAENEKGAVLLGHSPDLLAGCNWVLASVIAAVGGLIVGPIVGTVDPARYTLFIVPALGAALIGGLQSVVVATLGGLVLGMAESGTQFLSAESWFPGWLGQGAKEALPLLVVTAVLFVRGKSLPTRGAVEERPLPRSPTPQRVAQYAVILPILGLILASILTGPWAFALTTSIIAAILMMSYVVLTGYVGQISLAQLALAGTAAFAMTRLASDGAGVVTGQGEVTGLGLPLIVAVPLAIGVAVVVGVVIGLPALRIRGVQLAVITIAAALFLEGAYFDNPALTGVGRSDGVPVPSPTVFGLDLGVRGPRGLSDSFAFSAFSIVMLTATALFVTNLRRSPTGRRFLAVRANETAAASAGINVARTKLLAFAISSAIAGLAGCMFAFQAITISAANWVFFAGTALLAFAYLGGISSVSGALVGGSLATGGLCAYFSRFHFPEFGQFVGILGGAGLVLTAIMHPEGIAPYFQPRIRALVNGVLTWRARQWRKAAIAYGPAVVLGGVAGWVLWSRHQDYSVWMVGVGIVLALTGRYVIVTSLGRARQLATMRARRSAATPGHARAGADGRPALEQGRP